MNLGSRIALIAAAVLVAALGTQAYHGGQAAAAELQLAYESRSGAVARGLAIQLERILHYGIELDSIEGFEDQLREAVENYEGLSRAAVLAPGGGVVFAWGAAPPEAQRTVQVGVRAPDGRQVATVVVGHRSDLMAARIRAVERRSLLLAGAVFAGGLLLLVVALRWFVQRPLDDLRQLMEAIRGAGSLAPRMTVGGPREFQLVASSFNAMLDRLQRQAAELQAAKESADQANSAKSMFLAKMSHEIRTPMHAVMGMMEMLRGTHLDERQQRFLAAASRSADALLAIINDVLDFSRIEAGGLQLEDVRLDLPEIVHDCVDVLRPAAAAKGLQIKLAVPPEVGWVMGDPLRIRQVLWNLLSNAVKFTAKGRIELQVTRRADGVRFDVCDTGHGIAPEMLQRIFEPFRQSDDSIARHFGGTGLGLAIARELVHAMGGAVEVRSTVGEGTCFTVHLPLAVADPPDKAFAGASPHAGPVVRRDERRVLVVDDNELNRELVEVMLEGTEFVVQLAEDGPSALAAVQGGGLDLVLMDCSMPGMDGFEATRAIRRWELEGGRPRLPVIALTGNVAPDARDRCLAAGMDDLLTKPCRLEQLLGTLRHWAAAGAATAPAAEPASAGQTTQAAVDGSPLEELQAVRPGCTDLVARALELFERHARELLGQARAAAQRGDRAGVEQAAHTLASAGYNVGAREVGQLGRQLEASALSAPPAQLMEAISALESASTHALHLLRQRFPNP